MTARRYFLLAVMFVIRAALYSVPTLIQATIDDAPLRVRALAGVPLMLFIAVLIEARLLQWWYRECGVGGDGDE